MHHWEAHFVFEKQDLTGFEKTRHLKDVHTILFTYEIFQTIAPLHGHAPQTALVDSLMHTLSTYRERVCITVCYNKV